MRFMLIRKADEATEAGVLPSLVASQEEEINWMRRIDIAEKG